MPAGFDHDKTEPATQKRREEARKRGQVARSKEVSSVLILFMALGVFFFSGAGMLWHSIEIMREVFQSVSTMRISEGAAPILMREIMEHILAMLLPLMLGVAAGGAAANLAQVGFLFTSEPLAPAFSRLDPLKGMKRLLSVRSLIELMKSILKLAIIGSIAYITVTEEMEGLPSLVECSVQEVICALSSSALRVALATCLALAVLAAMDYAVQRWQYEKELRMSKQEVRDEIKQREGDPSIKARIRRVQLELSRRRMMEAVPHADVVITNPTRLAIALKYEASEMAAPQVIAKGAGFVAQKIREIAQQAGVPIVEQKPLAQALFKAVEIGESIPMALYQSVAEVLAYVYRLKGLRHPR